MFRFLVKKFNTWSLEQGSTIALLVLICKYSIKFGNFSQMNTHITIITPNNNKNCHTEPQSHFMGLSYYSKSPGYIALIVPIQYLQQEDKMNITFFQMSNGIRQNNFNDCLSSLDHIFQLALPIPYGNRWYIFLLIERKH